VPGNLLYEEESRAVIGAAIEVHTILGPGFLESVYEAAMIEESKRRGISFQSQVRIPIMYKHTKLAAEFVADYVAFGKIIVEFKAIRAISEIEIAQLLNYLKATDLRVGLLFNFGSHGKLETRRLVV